MKAVLIHRKRVPPRTHDLVELSSQVSKAVRGWAAAEEDLRFLSLGAVQFRYPGASATRAHALLAMRICRAVRRALRELV